MKHFVEIVSNSGEVVRRMEAYSQRDAEKIERGANINLNHDGYFTRIKVEDDSATEPAPHEERR